MDNTRPLRKDRIDSRELGDEWILIDLETDSIHILNTLAGFVWRMCDGCHSIEEMEQEIAEEFTVPDGTNVRADLQSVLQSFADKGMLANQET